MAIVSTSQNINSVTRASGEDVTINSGAILTIDAQVPADVTSLATLTGILSCTTSGKLRIVNTSTTDPLVLTLLNNGDDLRFEKNGIFETVGNSIELGTGTGVYQSFDLSSSPLDVIPYPSYVAIETAPSSGEYLPRLVFCTVGKTITYAKTLWGASGDNGNILFWNATTRVLETGDGTNGNFITSGCKVLIPNIYIHSGTGHATQASRTVLDLNPTGRWYSTWTAFSDNIWITNSAAGETILNHVGVVGGFTHGSTNSNLFIEGFQLNADTQTQAGNGLSCSAVFGESRYKNIAVTHSIASCASNANIFLISVGLGCTLIENILSMCRARSANSVACFDISNTPIPSGQIRNLIAIGGRYDITDQSNLTFINCKHTDLISDSQSTANGQYAFVFARSKNLNIVNLSKAGVSSARGGLCSTDTQCENISFFGGSYDCGNNTLTAVFTGSGKGLSVYNMSLPNLPSGAKISDSPTTYLSSLGNFYNVRGTLAGTALNEPLVLGNFDGILGTRANFATAFSGGVEFNSAHLLSSGLSTTDGNVIFVGFGESDRNSFTGDAQLDQVGFVEIPTVGDTATFESSVFHGITDFTGALPYFNYTELSVLSTGTTPPASMTVEFSVANPTGDFSAWYDLNTTYLPLAIPALVGYDSNEGIRVRVRFTATSTDSTRKIGAVSFTTVYDSDYQAPDASINFLGVAATDTVDLVLNEGGGIGVDTVLYTFIGSGLKNFVASNNFLDSVYFVRKTADDEIIMSTRYNPHTLVLGFNGDEPLFAGEEVQLAQSTDVASIKAIVDAYLDAAISTRATQASVNTTESKIDLLETKAQADARQVILISEHNATQSSISALNDFDSTTDQVIVATNNDKSGYSLANNSITSSVIATNALNNSAFTTGYYNSINSEVDSALADYDAPTKAELDTAESNIIAAIPDVSGLATQLSVNTVDSNVELIKAKTNQLVFTVAGQVDANALTGGGGDDAATIYTYFTSGSNEDVFKADVSGLMLAASYTAPDNSGIAGIKAKTDQFVFTVTGQVDANALTGGGGDDAATIYNYFTSGSNEDVFKADVTGLSTFDPVNDTVARVTLVDTTTTNTDMRGTNNAMLAASYVAPDNAGIAAIPDVTDIATAVWSYEE